MTTTLPDNHPLNLGQKIINFLQEKNDNKEHIIDEVINGYERDAIIVAMTELSMVDIVHFPNNNPLNTPSFLDAGEAGELYEIRYPVLAQMIEKE